MNWHKVLLIVIERLEVRFYHFRVNLLNQAPLYPVHPAKCTDFLVAFKEFQMYFQRIDNDLFGVLLATLE
jgi:hypothetical protein